MRMIAMPRAAADASHELKTPLAVISTRIDLIEFRKSHNQPIDTAIDDLRGDVDRMNAILTDLLSAARGAVNTLPVALADVIAASTVAVRLLADGADVTVETRVDGEPVWRHARRGVNVVARHDDAA